MPVLEVGDDGVLHVPGNLLAGAQPHAQFELDLLGAVVVLRPVGIERPFWRQATPGQRAEAFEQWVGTSRPDAPTCRPSRSVVNTFTTDGPVLAGQQCSLAGSRPQVGPPRRGRRGHQEAACRRR